MYNVTTALSNSSAMLLPNFRRYSVLLWFQQCSYDPHQTSLHYWSSVLADLSSLAVIAALQRIQNAAVGLVLHLSSCDHVSLALRELHWLSVFYHISSNLPSSCTRHELASFLHISDRLRGEIVRLLVIGFANATYYALQNTKKNFGKRILFCKSVCPELFARVIENDKLHNRIRPILAFIRAYKLVIKMLSVCGCVYGCLSGC